VWLQPAGGWRRGPAELCRCRAARRRHLNPAAPEAEAGATPRSPRAGSGQLGSPLLRILGPEQAQPTCASWCTGNKGLLVSQLLLLLGLLPCRAGAAAAAVQGLSPPGSLGLLLCLLCLAAGWCRPGVERLLISMAPDLTQPPPHIQALPSPPIVQVCGTNDGQLLLYNHATGVVGRQRVVAAPQTCRVSSVQYAPDGQLLAYGCDDGALVLWDPAGSMQLHSFRLHQRSVRCCSFSADGELLAAGDSSGLVSLWNAKQGNLLQVCRWAAPGAQVQRLRLRRPAAGAK
jgi:hypothetical protein